MMIYCGSYSTQLGTACCFISNVLMIVVLLQYGAIFCSMIDIFLSKALLVIVVQ